MFLHASAFSWHNSEIFCDSDLGKKFCDGNLTTLNLYGMNISGKLPAELPESLTSLDLRFNSISGTLPAKFPATLTSLSLGSSPMSGTLPAALPASLTYILLDDSPISGTLPAELPASLIDMYLWDNSISGTLPHLLPASLQVLMLQDNNFNLPLPDAVSQACMAMRACSGLPPNGCSAFGRNARMSAMNYGQCVACPDDLTTLYVLLVVTVVGCTLALYVYLWLVAKHPNAQGWIATSSIVILQVQLVSVVGLLSSIEGSTTRTVAQGTSLVFFDLGIASPECMMPAGGCLDKLAHTAPTPLLHLVLLQLSVRRLCTVSAAQASPAGRS